MTTLDVLDVLTAGLKTPLTLSGNEITPYSRAAGTQGDGLTGPYAGSSIGVWEATTNLVTNGGFETNTTGHAGNAGTETVSRITTDSKFGAACFSAVTPGGVTGEGWRTNSITISAATAYAASFWFKAPIGATLTAAFQNRDGADAFIVNIASNTTLVGDGNWQRVTLAGTSNASAANTRISLVTRTSAQAITILIDGVQVEAQPLATPYVHTDGGTASRSAARVRINNPRQFFSEDRGWMAFLFKMGWGNSAEPYDGSGFPDLFFWRDNSSNQIVGYYSESGNTFGIGRYASGSNTAVVQSKTFSKDDLVFCVIEWFPDILGVSADGAAFSTGANTHVPALTSTTLHLFHDYQTTPINHMDSDVLFFAAGKSPSTAQSFSQALNNIARNNRIDSRPEDLPGGCTFKWPSENWREGMAL